MAEATLALVIVATGASCRSMATIPPPASSAEFVVRDGMNGAGSSGDVREVVGVDVPGTDIVALLVDTRDPVVLTSQNATIVYVSDDFMLKVKLIVPDDDGLVGYERTGRIGESHEVLAGPRDRQVQARAMKPHAAALELSEVGGRRVAVLPDDLPDGTYVLTDDYVYVVLQVVSSAWSGVSYIERIKRVRDSPRPFSARVDVSYAHDRRIASWSSDAVADLGPGEFPLYEKGTFVGGVTRLAVAPSFRIPIASISTLELYAGPALVFADGHLKESGSRIGVATGFGLVTGVRPELAVVPFARSYGLTVGLDLRLEVGLLSKGPWSISMTPGFSVVPDVNFVLHGFTLSVGGGYDVVVGSPMVRFGLRV